MYALLRKAKQAEPPGIAEDAALRVREGALPILKAQPGFLLHLGFRSEACEACEASLFDDQAAAQEALGRLRAWTAANTANGPALGEPEERGGAVLHHRALALRRGGAEEVLFVTIREYSGVAQPEETLPLLNEHVLPVIERQSGMRGFWAFRDERDLGHAISVSLWSSRGAAFVAHERVVEVMAGLRDVFPTPPRITAGAARVVTASRAV